MSNKNLHDDIVAMLKDKGYIEAPSDNKSWFIFFQPDKPDTRWFVHETGKVRRGKSVHNSAAITPEARRMLGRWQAEQKRGPKTVKQQAPAKPKAQAQANDTGTPKSNSFNKALAVFEALSREDGATVQELIDLTGWQKHSVRGYLSNLRKKLDDKALVKYTRDNQTMYKIEPKENADNC